MFGLIKLTRRPRGQYARRHRALLEQAPALTTGFRAFVDLGDHLQVETRWQNGLTPADRLAALHTAANQLGTSVKSMAGGTPRTLTHWFHLPNFHGGTVIVSALLCQCHDGDDAVRGDYVDQDDVITHAVGDALRAVVPTEARDTPAAFPVTRWFQE